MSRRYFCCQVKRATEATATRHAEVVDPERLQLLLVPYAASEMEAYPVSPAINRPGNDSQEVLRPADEVLSVR